MDISLFESFKHYIHRVGANIVILLNRMEDYKRPKVNQNLRDLPVFYTPLTKMTAHWASSAGGACQDVEKDWARCAGRVGYRRAEKECAEYFEDFIECSHKDKQVNVAQYCCSYSVRHQGLVRNFNQLSSGITFWIMFLCIPCIF